MKVIKHEWHRYSFDSWKCERCGKRLPSTDGPPHAEVCEVA